jgi:FkbM family methyltransferase
MTTDLIGCPLKIVDAFSFVCMFREIVQLGFYRFDAESERPYIIDGGANIGLSVLYFKRLYPEAEILAFEPDTTICGVLSENVAGWSNVTVVQAALATSKETLGFVSEGSWAGRLSHSGENASYEVPSVRLKDYLDRSIDLLKLDIEGAETDVIFDCADRLDRVDHLFCEYHSFANRPQQLGTLLTLLTDVGFRFQIHSYGRSSPFLHRCTTPYEMDVQVNIFATNKRKVVPVAN